MWSFIQEQILGMKWLNNIVGWLLSRVGIDLASRLGGSLQFFFYDVVKITILLCVLIFTISYVQSFFPPERSRKILSRFDGITANIISALLGTVTPFCSCSSIPLFMGFTSAGLPVGVTFSFLISSPMVDLGSLVLLMSIFGSKIAIIYVILGLVIAVLGGSIIEKLGMDKYVEDFIKNAQMPYVDNERLVFQDRIDFAKEQVRETFKKVFPYILIGVGIGAVIHNWIPENWVTNSLGSRNPIGVILSTIIGIPMYADIFGSIPVAEALLSKGAQLGTVLSFMMAVTTLSLPSLIMLKKAIKPQLFLTFITICTVGIILIGYLFNMLQNFR
ncbi:permease [Streptococcus agalactiae]|uniref:permease n=1 Tax=Streptococcus agalactiae TaxID=1311 RepID=UPI000DFA1631|nr:permease [Streptococcus agalactiae]SUN04395.1 permease [Streptococcus agalactiae]